MTKVTRDRGIMAQVYNAYDGLEGWSEFFTYSAEQAEAFHGELRGISTKDARILELGFGNGAFVAWAENQGARVAATELNPACLAAAQERAIELLPEKIETVSHKYPNHFDIVVALDVFEHLSPVNIVERLSSISSMLKPGGYLILRFPNAQSPFGTVPQYGDVTHVTPLSAKSLEQLCAIAGSCLEVVRYSGAYRVYGKSPIKWPVRAVRYILQDVIQTILQFTYATQSPFAPVVTLVMRKCRKP